MAEPTVNFGVEPLRLPSSNQYRKSMKIRQHLPALVLSAALLCASSVRSGQVTFEGSVIDEASELAVARLGTFNPDFNPFSYSVAYGIDSYGNMSTPNYNRAVSDGVFRPIGEGSVVDGHLAGVGNAIGIEGQQLWLFVFEGTNPDNAGNFALFSGSTDLWRAPADTGSSQLFANSADIFVFGNGGGGGPISLQILPMPEPSSLLLLGAGGVLFIAGYSPLGKRLRRAQQTHWIPNRREH